MANDRVGLIGLQVKTGWVKKWVIFNGLKMGGANQVTSWLGHVGPT